MMPVRNAIGVILAVLVASSLACATLGPGATPTVAPPTDSVVVPPTDSVVAPPTATSAPAQTETSAPPPTASAAPVTDAPPTAGPLEGARLVVAAPDRSVGLVDLAGEAHPLSEAQAPLYALAYLDPDPGAPARAYNFSSAGVFPVDVVQDVHQGFAAYIGPAAPQGRLAWETVAPDAAGQSLISQIHVSSPDGSDARVVMEEAFQEPRVLRVWRWAADGQRLYFSREPSGLGGYILFPGISNLWVLDVADGSTTELVPDRTHSTICLDDLTPDGGLATHHCEPGLIGVRAVPGGSTTWIEPPADAPEFGAYGEARLSPDGTRVAFALARRDPENEQGWVAVSDGLEGGSRLVAASEAGDYFQVKQWLDGETLLLQSWGAAPGVWTVRADGSDLRRLADGTVIGVIG
jgi:hypothetical protein